MIRRGFTLMELMIVLLIGIVMINSAYQAIHLMGDAEKATEKASARAMVEARLTELLLRDLRSAASVNKTSGERYTIDRWILGTPRMTKVTVTWAVEEKVRVVREAPNEPREVFDFDGLLDPNEPAFKLRLEKVPDSTFVDPVAPATP